MKTNIIRYRGQIGTIVSDYDNREIKKFLPMNYGSYYSTQLDTINTDHVTEASFEDKVKFIEEEFHWGKVIKTHTIGEFQIIEYEAIFNGKNEGIRFHPYINFNDTNYSYYTLDEAIIGVIAYKHDGYNSQAAMFFTKMIGTEIDKEIKKNYYEE